MGKIEWWEIPDASRHGKRPWKGWNTLGLLMGATILALLIFFAAVGETKTPQLPSHEAMIETIPSNPLKVKVSSTPLKMEKGVGDEEQFSSLMPPTPRKTRETFSDEEEIAVNSIVSWVSTQGTNKGNNLKIPSGVLIDSIIRGPIPRTANVFFHDKDGRACSALLFGGGSRASGDSPVVESSWEVNFLIELWEEIKKSYR